MVRDALRRAALLTMRPGGFRASDTVALFPGALEGYVDTALVQGDGTQFEKHVDRVLPVYPRDLRHVGAEIDFLRDDGMRDAQGRLAKVVPGFEIRTLADQEFNDVVQALIGSAMQRRPAELSGRMQ